MSEMVERVAANIWQVCRDMGVEDHQQFPSWENLPEESDYKRRSRLFARAAIKAMMEPTPEMRLAAQRSEGGEKLERICVFAATHGQGLPPNKGDTPFDSMFKAALTAALED